MSQVLKSCVSQLEDIESQIRCARCLMWEDQPLSPLNKKFMDDLYSIMACIWYDVTLSPELISKRWVSALLQEPVSRVVAALKDVDYWLISQKFNSIGAFKQHLRLCYPGMGQLFSPLFRNISAFYSSGEGLPRLRTALRFATRANFPEPLGLEEKAWDDWQSICLQPWNEVDVTEEASCISRIFPRRRSVEQIDDFLGRFGPGSSAGLTSPSLADKYLSFGSDPMLRYIGKLVGFRPSDMPRHNPVADVRTGQLHFVPKQLDKLRTVSMEPCSLMFYQLGVQDAMLRLIQKSAWRTHINLTRADLNTDLAWEGSITGEYATIDLSSASDCVKDGLVRALFHDSCLRELLIGCRSRRVEYKGQYYQPEYYAPMGSGLCFPVECCVFAAIVDCVMRRHGDRRAWRVYGDDIIVPSEHAGEVIQRLVELGFKVNLDKSFYSTQPGFRESCGGDFFLGEAVRPVYVSRFWSGLAHRRSKPSLIESNVDLANRLFAYKTARLRVIKSLLAVRPRVLFDTDGESGLFSPCPTNYQTKSRWNADLQRDEYEVGMTKCRSEESDLTLEDIRLFEYLRAVSKRTVYTEPVETSISRSRPPIWVKAWRSPAPGWSEKGLTVLVETPKEIEHS